MAAQLPRWLRLAITLSNALRRKAPGLDRLAATFINPQPALSDGMLTAFSSSNAADFSSRCFQ